MSLFQLETENNKLKAPLGRRCSQRAEFLKRTATLAATWGLLGPFVGSRAEVSMREPPAPLKIPDLGGIEVFDPYQFGAKGDGRADDTAACNAAARKASEVGGVLVFRTGTFAVSAYVWIRAGTRAVLGQGGVLSLKNLKSAAGLVLAGRTAGLAEDVKGCDVIGLTIDCNRSNNFETNAIYGQNVRNCVIANNRIINLEYGNGILIRSFRAGASGACENRIEANQIQSNVSEAPNCNGISLDSVLDIPSPYRSALDYWRSRFSTASGFHPTENNVVRENTIVGGYYGIALSAASKNFVQKNRVSKNVRSLSIQNTSEENWVDDNHLEDSISSSIHLAYGSSENLIRRNSIYSQRAIGEGLLQAYVSTKNNLFDSNSIRTAGKALPKYYIYAAVHADGNTFSSNVISGPCSKAYIAVESAFSSVSSEQAHRNFGARVDGDYFSQRGMGTIRIIDNQIDPDSQVPVFFLNQVSDDRGQYELSSIALRRNRISSAIPKYFLMLAESTHGLLHGVTLEGNNFDITKSPEKLRLPRGLGHFPG